MKNNDEFLKDLLAEKAIFINNYECPIIDMHYNELADHTPPKQLDFLNHGYLPSNEENLAIHGDPSRFELRNSDFLVEHVVEGADFSNKRLLEVGSGRGGNCWYLAQYFQPSLVLGMDLNAKHIDACTDLNSLTNLAFVRGDAEDLPFGAAAFDSVINIESSHMYPNLKKFFGEVHRVLRPAGSFYYADIISTGTVEQRCELLRSSGFEITRMQDISSNVEASIEQRFEQIKTNGKLNPATVNHSIRFYLQVGDLALEFSRRKIRSYVSFQLRRV